MWAKLLVLFGALVLPQCWAHTLSLGACPTMEPMANFDLDKFLGNWYVIQKFATASSCMAYNFTTGEDGKLRLMQSRQHFLLDAFGVEHKYLYTGVLSTPDAKTPAKMRIKFPLNVAGQADFVVFMTDYDSYAATFTCQRILFGHVKSVSILSRRPQLEGEIIQKIRGRLEKAGINPHDLNVIDQTNCVKAEEANFNLNIDDKTFSAGNIAGAVKKAGSALGKGLDKAGEVVGRGVEKAGDLIGRGIETFGGRRKDRENQEDWRNMETDAEWLP